MSVSSSERTYSHKKAARVPRQASLVVTSHKTTSSMVCNDYIQFSSVQSLNCVRLFVTPWAARQASLTITNSRSLLKLMSFELVMSSNCLILCRPSSSSLESFPESGSFQMSQVFASGGQSFGASASASVLPINSQG